MKKLLICLLTLNSAFVSAGDIVTKSGDKKISAVCVENNSNKDCKSWYITAKGSDYLDDQERVIGKVSIEEVSNEKIDLNVKERRVKKFQYFPATNETWGCLLDENCKGDDAFWASAVFETPMMVIIGPGVTLFDIASMPIRASVKGIQNVRANIIERKAIKSISTLIDDEAEDIVMSERNYRKYYLALIGTSKGNKNFSLVEKAKRGEISGCKLLEIRPYANLNILDYELHLDNAPVETFSEVEIDSLELIIKRLIEEKKCSFNK